MNRNIAGTDLSPSSVHAIVEVGLAGCLTANDLRSLLILEKSSVSRLVQSLIRKGLVVETSSKIDGREKQIELTKSGSLKLVAINRYAESRISSSLANLSSDDRRLVLTALNLYSQSLTMSRKELKK